MPERTGQLHQISQAIGRIEGRFDGIDDRFDAVERYMHDREHGLNNLAQKVDALRVSIGKDIATVEAKFDARLTALERAHERDAQSKRIAVGIIQSPFLAGVIGSVVTWLIIFIAWVKGWAR